MESKPEKSKETVNKNFKKVLKTIQEEVMSIKSESENERKKKYHAASQKAIADALRARGIKPIIKDRKKIGFDISPLKSQF